MEKRKAVWSAARWLGVGVVLGGSGAESGRLRADSPRGVGTARRSLLVSLAFGAAALGSSLLGWLRSSPADGGGYQEVARWRIPEGEGRFIAVGPEPTSDELRTLGEGLRQQFHGLDNAVVMVFDDAGAARQVRRGSRLIGEERFQAALAHQRVMYVKQTARGEHHLVIYDRHPNVREVIQY